MLTSNVLKIIKNVLLLLLTMIKMYVTATEVHFSELYQDHLKVMTALVDEFYDPCEDFYQHACGYYNTKVAPIAPFMYNKEGAVKFFEDNRGYFTTTGGILLNGLYESCKQKNWDLSQWKSIDFLEEFSKWPFLPYQWEEAGIVTTWPNLTAQLAARGIPVFFDVFFAKNTIFISPADIRCPAEREEIKDLIMSPATSVLNNQTAEIISSELWLFCNDLTGIFPLSSEKPTEIGGSEKETKEFFDIVFEKLNISSKEVNGSRKIHIRTERLEEILTISRRTQPRIVINFIIWKMLEALKYEDCFQLTEEFNNLLLSEYWNWGVFESKLSKDVGLATFLYYSTRFQKRRKEFMYAKDWESFLDQKRRRKEMNLERVIKNYGNNNLSPENLQLDYSDLKMKRNVFFDNYFQMKRQKLQLSFKKDNYIDKEDPNHPANLLRRFLNYAILTGEQPLFHYFASQGFDLWFNSGLLYSTDDLYTAIDCLDHQSIVMYSEENSIFGNLTTVQTEELLKFNRAFYESYYDYLFWLEGEMFSFAEDYVLEHFNLNSSQVLFYSVAQLHCGRDDDKYSTLINRSFMNLWEFRDAFECYDNVPMNPSAKCMCKDC